MDLAPIFKTLVSSIVYIMDSFRFTLGGVTVSYLQFFFWFLMATFLVKIIIDFLGGR